MLQQHSQVGRTQGHGSLVGSHALGVNFRTGMEPTGAADMTLMTDGDIGSKASGAGNAGGDDAQEERGSEEDAAQAAAAHELAQRPQRSLLKDQPSLKHVETLHRVTDNPFLACTQASQDGGGGFATQGISKAVVLEEEKEEEQEDKVVAEEGGAGHGADRALAGASTASNSASSRGSDSMGAGASCSVVGGLISNAETPETDSMPADHVGAEGAEEKEADEKEAAAIAASGGGVMSGTPAAAEQHAQLFQKLEGSPSVVAFSLTLSTQTPPLAVMSPRLRERERAQVLPRRSRLDSLFPCARACARMRSCVWGWVGEGGGLLCVCVYVCVFVCVCVCVFVCTC